MLLSVLLSLSLSIFTPLSHVFEDYRNLMQTTPLQRYSGEPMLISLLKIEKNTPIRNLSHSIHQR